MSDRSLERSPALAASLVIHGAVIAAAIIAWPWLAKDLSIGQVVPVTIITNGPPAELSHAEVAPQPQEAAAEAPTPEAPPEPAPISSAPPAPPSPSSAPKPAAQTKPNPAKESPALKSAPSAPSKPAKQGLDLDSLLASLSSASKRPSTPATSGRPGPDRARLDQAARDAHGSDSTASASELGALVTKLGKLWNANCQVEGAAGINVKVHMRLTTDGRLAAPPELPDQREIDASGDKVLQAAAQRALSAVGRGQPYTELNPDHYSGWHDLIVNFDAKHACVRS